MTPSASDSFLNALFGTPNPGMGDVLGKAADAILAPVNAVTGAKDALFGYADLLSNVGSLRSLGNPDYVANGPSPDEQARQAAALQQLLHSSPADAANYYRNQQPIQAIGTDLALPLPGKSKVITSAGKEVGVGTLASHIFGNDAILNGGKLANAISKLELASTAPINKAVDVAEGGIKAVGAATGLAQTSRASAAATQANLGHEQAGILEEILKPLNLGMDQFQSLKEAAAQLDKDGVPTAAALKAKDQLVPVLDRLNQVLRGAPEAPAAIPMGPARQAYDAARTGLTQQVQDLTRLALPAPAEQVAPALEGKAAELPPTRTVQANLVEPGTQLPPGVELGGPSKFRRLLPSEVAATPGLNDAESMQLANQAFTNRASTVKLNPTLGSVRAFAKSQALPPQAEAVLPTAREAVQQAQAAPPDIVDQITQRLGSGGLNLDTQVLNKYLQTRSGILTGLAKDINKASALVTKVRQETGQPVTTIQQALQAAKGSATSGATDLSAILAKHNGTDILAPEFIDKLNSMVDQAVAGVYKGQMVPTFMQRVMESTKTQQVLAATVLGGIAAVQPDASPGSVAANIGVGLLLPTRAGQGAMKALRELSVMSGRFLANNLADQGFKSAMEHIRPWMTQGEAGQRLSAWGQLGDSTNPISGVSRVSRDVVAGYFDQTGNSFLHVFGNKAGNLGDKFQYANHLIEKTARMAAFIQGKEKMMQAVLPDFVSRLDSVSQTAGAEVQQSGGYLSVDALSQMLDRSGVQGDAKQQFVSQWSKLLQQGDQAGANLANRIHFNYSNQNNLDAFLKNALMFHVFSTRNLLYYPRLLADNPYFLMSLQRLVGDSSQEVQDKNLTDRYLLTVPGGDALSKVMGLFFGQNGEARVNPAQYIAGVQQYLPLFRLIRAQQRGINDEGQTPAGALVEGLGSVGLGANTLAQVSLGAAGAMGQHPTDVPGITPLQPVTAAVNLGEKAGILPLVAGRPADLDPLKFLAWQILAASGHSPLDYTDLAIRKRLADRGIEENAPNKYNAAMSDPYSEAYQQAARDVAGGNALTSMLGYTTGFSPKFLTDAEVQVRDAQRGKPIIPPAGFDPASYLPGYISARPIERTVAEGMQTQLDKAAYDKEVSPAYIADTFRKLLNADPQGMQKVLQQSGITLDANGTPLNSSGKPLVNADYQNLIAAYLKVGDLPMPNIAHAYDNINAVQAWERVMNKQTSQMQEQAILAQYQAAKPAEKALLLRNPEVAFVMAKQGLRSAGNGYVPAAAMPRTSNIDIQPRYGK